jgi:uncharacterized phiE125 gp8 family phage protein
MRKQLITGALFLPIEIDQVKQRPELRLEGIDDDPVIAEHIISAIGAFEEFSNCILCESTWDLTMDRFLKEIETPGPLQSVTYIKYLDASGVEQTLPTTVYKVDTSSKLAGRIALRYGQLWEQTYQEINAVTVRIVAGYANPASIPQRIKDGLMLKIQELYYGGDLSEAYAECWRFHRRIFI